MFSLIAGVKGMSENIEAISIVDMFLEHSRIFVFCNNGDPLYFISSADLMQRNLDFRVEVTCPIYDKSIQKELQSFLDIQWRDNLKARILDKDLVNNYKKNGDSVPVRAQLEFYKILQ
jgi:polyphosphate kinase